jgi:hypothetical protein
MKEDAGQGSSLGGGQASDKQPLIHTNDRKERGH